MFKKLLAVILLSAVIIQSQPVYALEWNEPDPAGEAIEFGIYTSLYATAWLLGKQEPFFDEPLIGGSTVEPYVEQSTVSIAALNWWMCGTYGFILLVPNTDGMLNTTTYMNAKGLFESMAYTSLFTQLTKSFFGRKRPSYDNYPQDTKETDGRESFISGHSSTAFTLAVYGSLFITYNTATGIPLLDYSYKAVSSALLLSAAAYTAWSRVHDHRHHVSDVFAGALVGSVSAVTAYMHQSGWFRKFTATGDVTFMPVTVPEWYGVSVMYRM